MFVITTAFNKILAIKTDFVNFKRRLKTAKYYWWTITLVERRVYLALVFQIFLFFTLSAFTIIVHLLAKAACNMHLFLPNNVAVLNTNCRLNLTKEIGSSPVSIESINNTLSAMETTPFENFQSYAINCGKIFLNNMI